ncbi:conserved hypothetical protein [Burkholderia cenocepacia]|uniref:hypothetical protein n=1 Tax=Burkholderia cenocepacia TaxID=95486 RepID=UPI00192C2DB0|nr:hypothetical protein [Burkholderia cenocepacia]CAD9227869.1 conserved hypothetical protein [Burkholderia cenocepacia]
MAHGNWDKALMAIRTRYWAKEAMREAMKEAGIAKQADFLKACSNASSKLGALYDIPWDSYLKGTQSPLKKTLDLVDGFAPGSSDCFNVGPYGIELWKVLQADKSDKNLAEAERLLDQVLALEHRNALGSFDLGLKTFWLVNPLLGFKIAPFEAEMVTLGSQELREYGDTRLGIREGDSLPWSDIKHLLARGVVVLDQAEEDLQLSTLLSVLDDSRKLYSLEHAFRRFKTKLIDYSYDYEENLGYSANLIAAAFGLWHLAVAKSNHRVKYIAEVLIEGLSHKAIEDEFDDIGEELKEFALNMIK